MRTLIWKEWRENRMIIVFAAALTFVAFLFPVIAEITHQINPVPYSTLAQIVEFIWVASALLCGSSMVAPEIGSGSLQLLTSMPVSRKQIWWTKIAVGLLISGACVIASSLCMVLLSSLGVATQIVTTQSPLKAEELQTTFYICLLTIPLFAVGAVVTMLADRTISAFMGGTVAAVIIYGLLMWSVTELYYLLGVTDVTFSSFGQQYVLTLVTSITTLVLFSMSYKLFINGETLKTTKRFKILSGFLLPPAFLIAAVFVSWLIVY